jgi:aspartate kinase
VARRIAAAHDRGNRVVAVVSAMGDTTDELIALAKSITPNPDAREMDTLLSTGELVSCTLVAMALREMGKKAVSLSGAQAGIRTDARHGKAKIASVDPTRVMAELKRGNIVVVAGFQGISGNADVTTLGRGGSDTTAVALAAGVGAARCEIYTDVEGIFTADPRLVPKARRLDEVGYEEMLEMASYGAKMQPRSIEMAWTYRMPVLVASSLVEGPGTLIHEGANMTARSSKRKVGEIRKRVRGIPVDKNVAQITLLGMKDRPGLAAGLFEPLAEAGIGVDVIVSPVGVGGTTDFSFTVKRTDLTAALKVVEPVAKALGCRGIVKADHLAKVSIVGSGLLDEPGYAAKMFRTLADANINIEVITTSDIRITCVVAEAKAGEAVRALHDAFELDRPD